MNNTCICCGEIIPEGRQVCPACDKTHIEVMARDICPVPIDCNDCHLFENGCHAKKYARRAYAKGYRKPSELLPCAVGQTVYKICPKCNEYHNGSCEHCSWRGCFANGCDIGVRIYSDGSHGNYDLQIIPRKVLKHNIITICELWNIMYFATEEEANTAKSEYEAIRNIKDRHERYEAYTAWASKREMHYAFLEGGAE